MFLLRTPYRLGLEKGVSVPFQDRGSGALASEVRRGWRFLWVAVRVPDVRELAKTPLS